MTTSAIRSGPMTLLWVRFFIPGLLVLSVDLLEANKRTAIVKRSPFMAQSVCQAHDHSLDWPFPGGFQSFPLPSSGNHDCDEGREGAM
jgi:hypothetical protein